MNPLYLPSPFQLKKQFLETDFYEDPDILEVKNEIENCPISKSLPELEKWLLNQTINRKVDTLWLHCTATPQTTTVTSITNFWKNNLGWKNPGYHIIFTTEGFSILQDLKYPTNGVRGHNNQGIHISYMGGIENRKPKDNRNNFQQQMFHITSQILKNKIPHLKIRGHNEVSNKACPSFNVEKEFKYLNNG